VRERVHPVDGRPPGLVLDLGDPRGRRVHGPEPLRAEPERVEHDEPRDDRVGHEHDRLPRVGAGERLDARAGPRGDLGERLAAGDAQQVRRLSPLGVRRGEARGDFVAREAFPVAEGHLAEGRFDLHREAVRLGHDLRRGASPLERARIDRRDDLRREHARDGLDLAQALWGERDVPRAGEAPLARPRGLAVPYDEESELAHNLTMISPEARKT
jgi:hypothetical protein